MAMYKVPLKGLSYRLREIARGQRQPGRGITQPKTSLFEGLRNRATFSSLTLHLSSSLEVAVLMVFWDCLRMIGLFYSHAVVFLDKTVLVR